MAMILQTIALCFVSILLYSPARSRPLHRTMMKREADPEANNLEATTIAIHNDVMEIYQMSENDNMQRTYQLIPINDTKLLSTVNAMPLELDQLSILCDVVAMDETAKLLNETFYQNISTVISKIFPNEEPGIVQKLCLTYKLSEYTFQETKPIAVFINVFHQVHQVLFRSPPISRNPNAI